MGSYDEVHFLGGAGEFLAEVGMCDADEGLGTLGAGQPLQADHALLGDDVIHVVPGGGDAGALREDGLDLGDGVVLGRGLEGQEGLAPLGRRGSTDEVHLSAGPAEVLRPDGLRADLTEQVDLHAGVDGDDVVVLRDDEGGR